VRVKDPYLYDLLGVPVGTSAESVLKRAYYTKARDCHPDKNLGDAGATERFQRLGEAYQILNSQESREAYDRLGYEKFKKRQSSGDMVDPGVLFTMLFGSEKFKDHLGTLRMAAHFNAEDATGASDGGEAEDSAAKRAREKEVEEKEREAQKQRVQELTAKMIERLQPWVDGQHADFVRSAESEARELLQSQFGGPMLVILGSMYVERADIFLDKQTMLGFGGILSSVKHSSNMFGAQIRTTVSAIKAMQRQQNLQEYLKRSDAQEESEDATKDKPESERANDGASDDPVANGGEPGHSPERASSDHIRDEDVAHVAIKTLVDMLELVWHVTTLDIQGTADDVAIKVLSGEDLGALTDQDKRDAALPVLSFVQQQFRDSASSDASVSSGHQAAPGRTQASESGWSALWNAVQTSWTGRPALREGERAITRTEILNARAAGLRELGAVFIREGQKVDATEELLKALGIEKAEAEAMETRVREIEERERQRRKDEKDKQKLKKNAATIENAARVPGQSESVEKLSS